MGILPLTGGGDVFRTLLSGGCSRAGSCRCSPTAT